MSTNVRGVMVLLAVMMVACGQGAGETGAGSSGSTSGSTGGDSSGSTGMGGAPTTSAGATTSVVTGVTTSDETSSGEATTGAASTSGATSGGGQTTGDESTGDTDGVCDPDAVLDAVSFNYIKTVDVGVTAVSAGYYNLAAGELVLLAPSGLGVRMKLDGTLLGEVEAPIAVVDDLDGAVYDPMTDTALLVDQDCNVAEVDPVTLEEVGLDVIDAVKFDVEVCSGLALGVDGNLYVASAGTGEVVVLSRDLMDEVDRFDVEALGIAAVDGIALIPGSENFLLVSGEMPAAGIFTASGEAVAPASEIGGGTAPLVGGGTLSAPDGLVSVCANGQVWLCVGLQSSECFKYAPEGGGEDVCGCLIEM